VIRMAGELFDGRIRARGELRGKSRGGLGARVGGSDELDARIGLERWQHQGECSSQPRYAEPELAHAHRSSTNSPERARDTHSMMWSAFMEMRCNYLRCLILCVRATGVATDALRMDGVPSC